MGAVISSSTDDPISLNDIRIALQKNLDKKIEYGYYDGIFTNRKQQISLNDIDVRYILYYGWNHKDHIDNDNNNHDINKWTKSANIYVFFTPSLPISLSSFRGKGLKFNDDYLLSYTSDYYT